MSNTVRRAVEDFLLFLFAFFVSVKKISSINCRSIAIDGSAIRYSNHREPNARNGYDARSSRPPVQCKEGQQCVTGGGGRFTKKKKYFIYYGFIRSIILNCYRGRSSMFRRAKAKKAISGTASGGFPRGQDG